MNEPYLVNIDPKLNKSLFLDFWKVPYKIGIEENINLHLLLGKKLGGERENSIIMLPGNMDPEFFLVSDSFYIFARVRQLEKIPDGIEKIASIRNRNGEVVSYIIKNTQKKSIYIPFSIDEVMVNYHYERYIQKARTVPPKILINLFYTFKPLIPRRVQITLRAYLTKFQSKIKFPRWPTETSLEDFKRFIFGLFAGAAKTKKIPFVWFWPNNKKYCLVLTHDVEGVTGWRNIGRIISLEKGLGFKSSFNIIPKSNYIKSEVLDSIKRGGFEIGVHGYNHDGRLFSSKKIFEERIKKINEIAEQWGARGFRSPSTYRNPDWYNLMELDYDSSFPDSDRYEPQPGGCLSIFPYFIGKIIELPITMPQDFTLFALLEQKDAQIWREKAEEIKKRTGMICLIAHPDKGYIGDKDNEKLYREFLDFLKDDESQWNALPKEVANWWKRRYYAEIVCDGGKLRIKAGAPEMVIKWGKFVDNRLKIEDCT